MIVIGLTGSIAMGKSTTASFFAEEGIPVNDADAVVHDLYRSDAVEPIGQAFPGTINAGVVDRQELSRQLATKPDGFKKLEAIVHPLVRQREDQFLNKQRRAGAEMVLLDIPLLFESGRENAVDATVVVTCDPKIQRARVLSRPNMTDEKFQMILSRQMPDLEKRQKADFIIKTDDGPDAARKQVQNVIRNLLAGNMSEKTNA